MLNKSAWQVPDSLVGVPAIHAPAREPSFYRTLEQPPLAGRNKGLLLVGGRTCRDPPLKSTLDPEANSGNSAEVFFGLDSKLVCCLARGVSCFTLETWSLAKLLAGLKRFFGRVCVSIATLVQIGRAALHTNSVV